MPPIRPGFLFACGICKVSKLATQFKILHSGRPSKNCIECLKERQKQASLRHRKVIQPRQKEDPNSLEFKCIRCLQILPRSSFYKNAARYRGYDNRCIECSKEEAFDRYLRHKFNITADDYNKMLHDQEHCCFICGKAETVLQLGKHPRLSVDHCHKTGKVRSLLCYSCNHLIGFLERLGKDQVNKSWDYIDKHS